MKREGKNSHRRVRSAENQVKTLRMIVAGISRADIARQLGVSVVSVGRYIEAAMKELAEEHKALAPHVFAIEYARIEAMIRAVAIQATDVRKVSLPHLDRFAMLAKRQTELYEKTLALGQSSSEVGALPPGEAERIAALIPIEATDEERAAIANGDQSVFAAVAARIRATIPTP
jgi:hypothetical protein